MIKPKVKLRIVDWHVETEEDFYNHHFVQLLSKKYDVEYSDKPDFIIHYAPKYSRADYLDYHCTRIFYTRENIRPNFNVTDYAIGFDFMEFEDRYLRIPLLADKKHQQDIANRHTFLAQKKKFCSMLVSHSSNTTKTRENFFYELSKYKKVDSGGKWNNNILAPVQDKVEWLKDYKFNICFENSSYPGYLTEKLFEAFAGGCIPIYYGDTSLRIPHKDEYKKYFTKTKNNNPANNKGAHASALNDGGGGGTLQEIDTQLDKTLHFNTTLPYVPSHLLEYTINPKAFINAHDFENAKDLIDEIKRIDSCPKSFEEMLHEPVFLGDFDPYSFYDEKVFNFLCHIIDQGAVDSKRMGEGIHLLEHRALLESYNGKVSHFIDYCYKYEKLIRIIRTISESPRDLVRKIRRKK